MKLSLRARWLIVIVVAVVCYRLQPWHNFYERSTRQRAAAADSSTEDIEIAVVWPAEEFPSYLAGAQLAAEQINNQGGVRVGGLGRNIALKAYDESSPLRGEQLARQIGQDPNIVAVIGHSSAASAVPAAIAYEYRGIVYLSPIATVRSSATRRFDFVFRTVPSDHSFARAIIREIGNNVSRSAKVVLLYPLAGRYGSRESAGLSAESLLRAVDRISREAAAETEVSIAFQSPYPPLERDYRELVQEIVKHEFDLVVIAGALPGTASLREQLITAGVAEPIFDLNQFDWGHLSPYMAGGRDLDSVFLEYLPRLVVGQLPRQVAVLNARNLYGRRFASLLNEEAAKSYDGDPTAHVRIAFDESYAVDEEMRIREDDYWALVERVAYRPFDAIVIADDDAARAAHLIRLLRERGVRRPILTACALDANAEADLKSVPGTRTVVASVWDPISPESQSFVRRFKTKYQQPPGLSAAQGYQAVFLLKRAFEQRNSTVPRLVAEALKYSVGIRGIENTNSYSTAEEISNDAILLKELVGERFTQVVNKDQGY